MKSLTLILATFFFFTTTVFAQVAPTLCATCKYGYEKKGTRTLVGEKRNYYGSVKTGTKSGFSATPTGTDRKLKLQDVFPGMDSLKHKFGKNNGKKRKVITFAARTGWVAGLAPHIAATTTS